MFYNTGREMRPCAFKYMGRAPFAQFFCVMPLTLYVARTVCGYELASGIFQGNPNRAFVEQRIITDMGSRCIRCAGMHMRGYGDYTAHPDFDPHDFSTDK